MKMLAKKLSALALCAAMTISGFTLCASAATTTDIGTGTVNGNVEIDGSIAATTISVTHPITEAYSIDPNKNTFTAPAIAVTNNTVVPINVAVTSLKSVASADANALSFTDKLPADENWGALNNADSKKFIALGVDITDKTGWNAGYVTDTDWAAAAKAVTFGSLNANATGNFGVSADFGRSFDAAYTAKHALVFTFNLV